MDRIASETLGLYIQHSDFISLITKIKVTQRKMDRRRRVHRHTNKYPYRQQGEFLSLLLFFKNG